MKRVNITLEQKSYSIREEIRALRTNLQFCGDDKQVIMMTSCLPGEGKTSVSIELTEAIADMGEDCYSGGRRYEKIRNGIQVEGK